MKVFLSDYAWIDKSELPTGGDEQLRKRLTIQPRKTYKNQDEPKPILLYAEKDGKIGLPRSYFMERRKLQHDIVRGMSSGRELNLNFNGTLLEDQQRAIEVVERHRLDGGVGGIVKATTGWGKTVAALNFWTRCQCSALVIVNRTFLMDQWRKRIEGTFAPDGELIRPGFVPDAKVGIVKGNKCQYGKDFDISLATIQTLAERRDKFPDDFWDAFGLIIIDETHRISAPTWCGVAPRFRAAYRLGVSATPRRKDGTEAAFIYHIGEVLYTSKVKRVTPSLRYVTTGFTFNDFRNFPSNMGDEILKRFLVKSPWRNRIIVDELCKAVQAGRKILVLSERRKHLQILHDQFVEREVSGVVSSFYLGGMKREELDEAEKADILFATYQMVSEGFDVETLDTVFLTMPMSDVEQAVGRIMRVCSDKKQPVVVDFIDDLVPKFNAMWNRRKEFYVKEGICGGSE